MEKRWTVLDYDREIVSELSAEANVPPIMAKILATRGLVNSEAVSAFLNPQLSDLHDPSTLPDIAKAAERVRQAAMSNQKVVIYGDYDVDGVSGSSVLVQFLKLLNMDVSYYIPHRIDEGYGLNVNAIRRFKSEGIQLVITVDCGINAVEEVREAANAGIDVIITDHHEPGIDIPDAYAVVNPKMPRSQYPFKHLSGAGVAFKLAWAIAQTLSPGRRVSPEFREFLMDALGLAALGTIADVVPLTGENRVLAKFGLEALAVSRSPGVRALIESSGLDGQRLASHHVSFRLAPRLNAAGRMAKAVTCVELLTTNSTEKARAIAEQLEQSNRHRQETQQQVLDSVRRRIETDVDLDNELVVVLADKYWHPGVLGIVASRIVDDHCRPTVLVALDEGIGKGSGRSIPQFNLFDALAECGGPLESFGGHAQAAGIKIKHNDVEAFRTALNSYAAEKLNFDELVCSLAIDVEIEADELTIDLVNVIDRMQPYGEGNREPVFCSMGLRLAGTPRLVGKDDRHLAFYVRHGNASFRTVGFGMADIYDSVSTSEYCDMAFKARVHEYNGRESVQLQIADIKTRK